MQEFAQEMEQHIKDKAKRIAKNMPIRVYINGLEMDTDAQKVVGEEIHMHLTGALYNHKTRQRFIIVKAEDAAEMLEIKEY